MNIDYDDSRRAKEVTARAREFMDEVVLPMDRERPGGEHVSEETVQKLRAKAREYNLYAPQMPEKYGGMGLDFIDALPVFEEVGRSLVGPMALRLDAPDEGNMHMLEIAGTEAQKEEWLQPLVDGEIRSAFSMTEPKQGGGADPKMIKTHAEKDGDEWVITGHKWWTSQAVESELLLVLARTDQDRHPYEGCSMFIVSKDTPGVDIKRNVPHLGNYPAHMSHCEVTYDHVRVPEANVLGDLHGGFQLAQQRLGPARLTHCMRYSGMAMRALDVAKAYMNEREAFGDRLTEKQALRFDIAEAEMDLHAARAIVRHAADEVSAGREARVPVSMCKVFTANVVQDVIDTALQVCGGNGIGKDLPLADFYEYVRHFRIVDGPDEVHKRVVARGSFEDIDPVEVSGITTYEEPGA